MDHYHVGDIIVAEAPFAHVLEPEYKSIYCDNCCKKNSNLKKCINCKNVYYCNRECQKSDWKWHKYECKFYKQYYDEMLSKSIARLLLRIHLYLRNNPRMAEEKFASYDTTRSYNQLTEHREKIRNDEDRMQMFNSIWTVFAYCQVPFDEEKLFSDYCKMRINANSLYDTDQRSIGNAVYLLTSFFRHSCAPNAATSFSGNRVEIRAIKTIMPGDQITIAYTDLTFAKKIRHDFLKTEYYFDCKCTRCESDFDEEFDYEKLAMLGEDMKRYLKQPNKIESFYCGLAMLKMLDILLGSVHPLSTVLLATILKIRYSVKPALDQDVIGLIKRLERQFYYTHEPNHELRQRIDYLRCVFLHNNN